MSVADNRIKELQNLERQLEKNPQPEQQRHREGFDPSVTSHAKQWVQRNSWFKQDANGNALDEDSDIATTLSGRLVKEGYDPKTQDFWDELDDRVQKRLPHVTDSKEDDDEEEDEPIQKQAPRKRAAPPVGGGANRGDVKGKVAVNVSTAFLDELKKNGLYDDPATRNAMIHEHLKWKRENPERQ